MNDEGKKLAPKNNEEENKPKLCLLPFDVLEQDAVAYEYGVHKYEQYSWMGGFITSELISSALRHIKAFFWEGEKYDREASKAGFMMHHLASARFCLASIMHAEIEGVGIDDRPCYKAKEVFKQKLEDRKKRKEIVCPFCGFCHKGDDLETSLDGKMYVDFCKNCNYNFALGSRGDQKNRKDKENTIESEKDKRPDCIKCPSCGFRHVDKNLDKFFSYGLYLNRCVKCNFITQYYHYCEDNEGSNDLC